MFIALGHNDPGTVRRGGTRLDDTYQVDFRPSERCKGGWVLGYKHLTPNGVKGRLYTQDTSYKLCVSLEGLRVVREQTKTRHSFVTVGRAAGVSVNADQLRAVSPATAIRDSTCPGDLDSVDWNTICSQ